ncbi:serine endoprotease [Bacteroidales bacterium]|nr:serine endoprotease [Bacteroidales bacterium]
MKRTLNIIALVFIVGLVSAAASAITYQWMNNKHGFTSIKGAEQSQFINTSHTLSAENTDFTVAAEKSVHAVVHIKSISKASPASSQIDPFEFLFGPQGGQRRQSQPKIGFGSGVIISADGYIITNNHVIDGADEIMVTTNGSEEFKAKLIGGDPATDIALLKIEGKEFPIIPFGNSDNIKVGEWVLAVGNPFNLTSTVTAGIVSAKGRGNSFPSRPSRGNSQMKIESYIQTDAAVNPGNSGGALVNTRGELIGINTAIYSETGNFAGYSFAVPASIASKIAADLKQHGAVQRAVLGVSIANISQIKATDPDKAAKLSVNEGAYIAGFAPNSAAKAAGIEEGDVITAIEGNKVKSVSDLQEQVNRHNPGKKIKVSLKRGSKDMDFMVELKNIQGGTDIVKNISGNELLGATLKELSAEKKKDLKIDFGIEVTNLSNGKVKEAGIQRGFVIMSINDVQIKNVEQFEKIIDQILQQNEENKGLLVKGIYPNGRTRYYALDLNNE